MTVVAAHPDGPAHEVRPMTSGAAVGYGWIGPVEGWAVGVEPCLASRMGSDTNMTIVAGGGALAGELAQGVVTGVANISLRQELAVRDGTVDPGGSHRNPRGEISQVKMAGIASRDSSGASQIQPMAAGTGVAALGSESNPVKICIERIEPRQWMNLVAAGSTSGRRLIRL